MRHCARVGEFTALEGAVLLGVQVLQNLLPCRPVTLFPAVSQNALYEPRAPRKSQHAQQPSFPTASAPLRMCFTA